MISKIFHWHRQLFSAQKEQTPQYPPVYYLLSTMQQTDLMTCWWTCGAFSSQRDIYFSQETKNRDKSERALNLLSQVGRKMTSNECLWMLIVLCVYIYIYIYQTQTDTAVYNESHPLIWLHQPQHWNLWHINKITRSVWKPVAQVCTTILKHFHIHNPLYSLHNMHNKFRPKQPTLDHILN